MNLCLHSCVLSYWTIIRSLASDRSEFKNMRSLDSKLFLLLESNVGFKHLSFLSFLSFFSLLVSVSTQSKCCISLCVSAAGGFNKLKWLLAWPLALLLFFTIPNSSTSRWENWFMLSFVASTLWIASFSYIMVWMVSDDGGKADLY